MSSLNFKRNISALEDNHHHIQLESTSPSNWKTGGQTMSSLNFKRNIGALEDNHIQLECRKKLCEYSCGDGDDDDDDVRPLITPTTISISTTTTRLQQRPRRIPLEAHDSRTNDEIHGTIRFCPVMKALMDSPQFQRLRCLKQLGTSSHVFICSNHTRFEHSIGVAHLAQRVCEGIQNRQPALQCSSKDILCVKLAGLLHDIGHGPFSHVFELFVKHAFPAYFETLDTDTQAIYNTFPTMMHRKFGHETVSLNLIDASLAHLGLAIDLGNLDAPLKEIGDSGGVDATTMRSFDKDEDVLTSRDFVFIKECIWGKPIPDIEDAIGKKGFTGRPGWEKEWMYDIVANRHSGLDVDKIDYFARDSRRCFGDGRVDEVLVEESVVAWGTCTDASCRLCRDADRPHRGKHLMICFPAKMTKAAISFFNKRFELHSTVYHHKTTRAVSHMVCDILCKADPFFRLSTAPCTAQPAAIGSVRSFPSLPPSRAMMDTNAFIRLRDSVIEEIANSTNANLEEAAHLANRFLIRDLYKCIFWQSIDEQNRADRDLWSLSPEEIAENFLEFAADNEVVLENINRTTPFGPVAITADDVLVDKFTMHHGRKDQNPIDNIRVVVGSDMMKKLKSKDIRNLPVAVNPDISQYKAQTPMAQQQHVISVYCRTTEKSGMLSLAFKAWIDHQKTHWQSTMRSDVDSTMMVVTQTPKTPIDHCHFDDDGGDNETLDIESVVRKSKAICSTPEDK